MQLAHRQSTLARHNNLRRGTCSSQSGLIRDSHWWRRRSRRRTDRMQNVGVGRMDLVSRRSAVHLSWLVYPVSVALWIVSMKAYRKYVSENLSRLAARQLHLSGYVLKTFCSWHKGQGATAFLTPESFPAYWTGWCADRPQRNSTTTDWVVTFWFSYLFGSSVQ